MIRPDFDTYLNKNYVQIIATFILRVIAYIKIFDAVYTLS